jgi:hypothetical protein
MTINIIPTGSKTTPPAEVLIVGFGAVGVICKNPPSSDKKYAHIICLDGYLLEQNGKARVTAVARSKYDTVIGEPRYSAKGLRTDQLTPHRQRG